MFKKGSRYLSFIIGLLMIVTSIPVLAEDSNVYEEDYMGKIGTDVLNDFSKGQYTSVIVYLKEQVETEGEQYSSRDYLIKELKDTAEKSQKRLLDYLEEEKRKANVVEYNPYYIINGVYVEATEEVIRNIASMNEVSKVYSNSLIEIEVPERSNPMTYGDNSVEWNIERIGANRVWDEFNIDGRGIVVGIIDSGVHWEHEALKEKWRGYNPNDPDNPVPDGNWYDAISGERLPYDEPGHYHGTHVTGIILGQDKNGQNKIGVAPEAKWIAARAFTKQGAYPSWLLEAGQWMLAPNGDSSLAPDIINNSWATTTPKDGLDEWYRGMVRTWRAAGILPIFATGNDAGRRGAQPGSVSVPANYPESFAVGAVDKENILAKFSKRGPSPYEGEIKPEVVAPGLRDAEIPASLGSPAVPATGIRSSVPGGYQEMLGTSMAAPHVSGVAALLLSANKDLTVEEVERVLIDTAIPLKDDDYEESPNQGYGYGLINAYDAIKSQIDTDIKGVGTIKGRVLGKVEEIEELEILHESIEHFFHDTLVTIEGRVRGDIAVKEVSLLVKSTNEQWLEIPMKLRTGSFVNGVYSANVPIEFTSHTEFTYKIKATDHSENTIETEEYRVIKSFGILPDEYETDFSVYPVGWKFDGDWEWGQTYNLPYVYDGLHMIGTNLSGNYSPNTTSILEMPPIDLRNNEIEHVVLKVEHYREFDLFNDVASILISTDNKQSWVELESFAGQYNYYWERFSFLEGIAVDLTPYIGTKNPIYIRFQLVSDDDTEMRGWYLNDVSIIGTDMEAPKPPKSLNSQQYPAGVALNWVAPWSSDVSKYRVYRGLKDEGSFNLIGETVSRNYIDLDVEVGQGYIYKVSAVDIFGNESIPSIKESYINIESVGSVVYFSDFEDDDGKFTSGIGNNHWQWGVPTRSEPKEAFTGSKLWGTNLSGKYSGNTNAWIESPEISLPDDQISYISFHHWLNGITGDYGEVLISQAEGENWSTWEPIGSQYKTISRDVVWKQENIDLSNYKGKKVKFRFVLNALKEDEEIYTTGWYIDDVLIYSMKEEIEVDTIEFDNFKEVTSEIEDIQLYVDKQERVKVEEKSIPVDATVTILETGKNTKVNLINGSYELNSYISKTGETFTLRIEAYGYETQEAEIELSAGESVTRDFILEKAKTRTLKGRLIDKETGKGIEGSTIKIKEDLKTKPAKSDEKGNFEIKEIYEGEYTLIIEGAGYEVKEIRFILGNEPLDLGNIELEKSKSYSAEIKYDDGTAERAVVGNSSATRIAGTAIRVTPPKDGKVIGANIYFTDESYPVPGGNRIGIAIFTSGKDGMPNEMIKAPIFFNINRGNWNYLDLSSLDFWTKEDFFIATVQDDIWDFMPAVGVDDNTVEENRSYMYMNDRFFDIGDRFGTGVSGTLMIRGVMDFEIRSTKYPLDIGRADIIETDEEIIIRANIINTMDKELDGTMILKPIDDNGIPYKIIYERIEFYEGLNIVEFGLKLEQYPKKVSDIHIYIWDSLENMKPLADIK